MKDIVNKIMKYETGGMTDEEFVIFFQQLFDTGIINSLQGHYGRTMKVLIDNGFVIPKKSLKTE